MDRKKQLFPAVFLALLLLFLALRLWDFRRPFSKDEVTWVWPASRHVGTAVFNLHPPLGIITYTFAWDMLGTDNLRLWPIFFATIAFVLGWILAARRFGKGVAIWAAFLSAVSFYSIIAAQQIDMDGGVLAAVYLAGFLAFLRFVDSDYEDRLAGAAFGLAVGISLMTRIVEWSIYIPFIIYPLARRKLRPALVWPLAIPLLLLAGWAARDFSANGGDNVLTTLRHSGDTTLNGLLSIKSTLTDKARFFYVMQRRLTPPFCVLLACGLWWGWKKRKDPVAATVLGLLVFVSVLFTLPYDGDKPRYLSVALPFAFLLAGGFLSDALSGSGKPRRNEIALAILLGAATLVILRAWNLTEWETTGNFVPFTIAKLAITAGPALAFLLLGRKSLVLLFLAASFAGFSAYYTFFASSEKDSSKLVAELRDLGKPAAVFGEYGLPFYWQEKGLMSASIAEDPTDAGKLFVSGSYFPAAAEKGLHYPYQVPFARIDREGLGSVLKEYGLEYLVITKKIIVGNPVQIPAFCSERFGITRNGELQATVYECNLI